MTEELSDKELLLLVTRGDEHAFDIIFRRYHRVLYLYSLKLLKDPDVAADIVQGVFVKLWEHAEYLPADVNVKSYIYSMVRNKVINYIRDNRSRLIHNYIIVQENGLVQDLEFLSHVEEVSMQQELEKALDSLPPQQRKIIHLRFEGKSNRQIAEEENLSLNTVNVHYRLAMKKLRTLLKVVPLILLILC